MSIAALYLNNKVHLAALLGLEPRLPPSEGYNGFLATPYYYGHSLVPCCSLDYFFTISYDLGGSCIVSTHL